MRFSPHYPSIPFTSLSLSFSPSLSFSLSYLSLPLYISPSTFLSLSFLLSLFSLSFSYDVSNGRFCPCLFNNRALIFVGLRNRMSLTDQEYLTQTERSKLKILHLKRYFFVIFYLKLNVVFIVYGF